MIKTFTRSVLTIITLGALASLTSCREVEDEFHHYYIHFSNNSDKNINATYGVKHGYREDSEGYLLCSWGYRIKSNSGVSFAYNDYFTNDVWEYIIGKDTLVFNILDDDFKRQGDTIHHSMASYRFSREDMQKLDWHVAYPPTEEMLKYNVKVEDKYYIQPSGEWK